MEEQKVDYGDVINSLTGQVADKSSAIAFQVALIKQKDKQIKEMGEELKKLRNEQIRKMDEDAE